MYRISHRPRRGPADRWRPFMVVALLLSLLGSALPTLAAQPAAAAPKAAATFTFTVDHTLDAVDATPGDTSCASVSAGCTLRAAIMEANALAAADATRTFEIILAASTTYTLTIMGAGEDAALTGDLDIMANVTITGNGATVRGLQASSPVLNSSTDADRVFDVFGGYTVAINNLTIEDGYAVGSEPGGGIRHESGIRDLLKPLTLTGVTVEDSDTGFNSGCGAGIYNGPGQALNVIGSTIKDNGLQSIENPGDGGGICNDGTLTLDSSVVSGNFAANGGGLANFGQATITGSTFSGNTVIPLYTYYYYGYYGYGGGIYSEGTLQVTGSRILGNSATWGGGIYNSSSTIKPTRVRAADVATVTILGSDITNNVATIYGGGIANDANLTMIEDLSKVDVGDSVIEMTGGSLRNNTASGTAQFDYYISEGVVVFVYNVGGTGGALSNIGTATLTGVTVDGNSAASIGTGEFSSGNGGGLYNIGVLVVNASALTNNYVSGPGTGGAVSNGFDERFLTRVANGTVQRARTSVAGTSFAATNVTISGNSAPGGGGAIVNADDSAATLNQVTIANNSSGILTTAALVAGVRARETTTTVQNSIVALNTEYNCSGLPVVDGGYNLESANTCAFTATGSQSNVADPKLGPLAVNAPGTTATHALLAGSPALDKIPATGAGCPATDQRGVTRPQPAGGLCDIGAYELIPAAPSATPSPSASPSPSATPNYTTVLTITGPGAVSPGAGSYTSPAGSTQTYTASPAANSVLLGWTIDGQFAGFGNPLALPVTKNRTVVAAFAPIPQFCDITTSTPNYTAISQLAARGVILGYDNRGGEGNGLPKCFRPDDILLRIHVAGFVARIFGWDAEDHGNIFTDKGPVDNDLWRNAGTLAFYNVARGYEDNTFRPLDPVLKVQGVSFVARAMIRKDYWTLQEDNAAYYTALPPSGSHRQDSVTYYTYAGNIPGTSAPTDPWGGPTGYDSPSSRSYFAQVLWQAYSSYFSVNRIP